MAWLRLYKSVRPLPGFTVDEAPTNASLTAELFATVRDNGRIIDQTRHVIGGSGSLEAVFPLGRIFPDPELEDWEVRVQRFPRDLDIRRGLLSGNWANIVDVVASRNASIFDGEGSEIPAAEFIRRARDSEAGPQVGAMRWAVTLSDSARLALQLQGLPATAAMLNGKPSLKVIYMLYQIQCIWSHTSNSATHKNFFLQVVLVVTSLSALQPN